MKKRFSDGSKNDKIISKEFKYIYDEFEEFKGYISLIKIKDITRVCTVPRENREDDCILDKDYTWLSIYPTNKNYAITVMFNDKLELVEWYFDITNSTGIENNVPYIEDLYLDVVITNLGEIIVLDEDELEQALEENYITKEQYDMAIKVGKNIIQKYSDKEQIKKLYDFTIKCLNKLV